MEQVLVSAAKQLEQQLDNEISRLDNLGTDDIEAIRDRRLKEMKLRQEKLVQWKQNVKKKTWWAIRIRANVSLLHFRDTANTQSWSMRKSSSLLARKVITSFATSIATLLNAARSSTSIWRFSRRSISKLASAKSTRRSARSSHSAFASKSFPASLWSKTARQKITSWASRISATATTSAPKWWSGESHSPEPSTTTATYWLRRTTEKDKRSTTRTKPSNRRELTTATLLMDSMTSDGASSSNQYSNVLCFFRLLFISHRFS